MRKHAVKTAQAAQKAMRDVDEARNGVGPVVLCGQAGPIDPVRAALAGDAAGPVAGVESYAIRRLRPDDHDQLRRGSVVVYGGVATHTLDDETRADLDVIGRVERPIVVVLEGVDVPMDASIEAARVRGVEPRDVLAIKRGRFPAGRVLRAIADAAGPSGPALAVRVPALRPHVVESVIEAASRRNSLIATAVWIPGADMPLLTAVQMRMLLEIGVCYGVEPSADRAVELVGVLGAGFGLRSAARELLDVIPFASWLVQGGVAYGGTRALGRAAVEYFERGAPADVTRLRTTAERLRA